MSKNEETIKETTATESKKMINGTIKIIGGMLLATVVLVLITYGLMYLSSPAHIRYPTYEHYHLRTQIIVDGQAVDFSADEYQQEYDAGTCSAELSGQPIDFHDNEDQMTHVHWSGITGGELLKNYGWNLIGGNDNSLGRRYDQGLLSMYTVDIYGDLLPEVSEEANYYVYIGDEDSYEQKDWDEFLDSNLEDFFGVKSGLNTEDDISFNVLDLISSKAYAHGGEVKDEHSEDDESDIDEEKLTRLNNLIGNVVVFVQAEEPSEDEIKERFNRLVPLHDSTCGG